MNSHKKYYKENVRFYKKVKKIFGCQRCNLKGPSYLFDFHHVDPSNKTNQVGKFIKSGYGRKRIKEEMRKCILLCANCHRLEHEKDI